MTDIVISSGHGKYIRGASGDPVPPQCDEVDEARKVVDAVAGYLRKLGAEVVTFHDDTSHDQQTNLETIVNFHNSQDTHDLDVSVHFNCYNHEAEGCEVLYLTQETLADDLSAAIAHAGGFENRGAKYNGGLYFLNSTWAKAVLLEICFCDNTGDCEAYRENFDEICEGIAIVLAGALEERVREAKVIERGKCSWFGGPDDDGVSPSEGLAFLYEIDMAPNLFLPEQPSGTTGLARRLNPARPYIACRWDYDVTPKEMLADRSYHAMVRSLKTGKAFRAWPADWGPHEDTGRVADISPGLMEALGITTDDEIEVIYPWREQS